MSTKSTYVDNGIKFLLSYLIYLKSYLYSYPECVFLVFDMVPGTSRGVISPSLRPNPNPHPNFEPTHLLHSNRTTEREDSVIAHVVRRSTKHRVNDTTPIHDPSRVFLL